MSLDFADPAATAEDIARDRWGRPLVIPPGGGKPVAYTRCTTFVDCLEDKYNLQKWMQRMVALGLVDRDDLLLAAAAHRDDKKKLDAICEEALEAAKGRAAATTGTALHALTEQHDRGLTIGAIPATARADLNAYVEATADYDHLGIEQFVVCDELKVGGTFDRLMRHKSTGRVQVGDVKTGSVDFGMLKIAMQLAVYAHSLAYDPATGQRTPLEDVDLQKAIVIHLPAGTGTCQLLEVDIAAGWQAVQIAKQVRGWRAKNDLARVITNTAVDVPADDDPLIAAINVAATVDELNNLWRDNAHDWTSVHTSAAADRKRHLQEGAAA